MKYLKQMIVSLAILATPIVLAIVGLIGYDMAGRATVFTIITVVLMDLVLRRMKRKEAQKQTAV